jgi:F-type H+-transporting ATPase subunit c
LREANIFIKGLEKKMPRFGKLLTVVVGVLFGCVAFASDSSAGDSVGMAKLGAAIVMGLGAFGAASAQGRAAGSALEGLARNPSAKADVFVPMLLSLVFMEFQALMCFVIAFLLLG